MSASFTTVPPEIRREVYSYLLRDTNSYVESDITNCQSFSGRCTLIAPDYCTSLFTVNKQISNEALEYFYVQNAFVAVQAPDMEVLLASCQFFPAINWFSTERTSSFQKHSLAKMALVARIMIHRAGEIPQSLEQPYAALMLSARHLETLIRIFNSKFSSLADGNHEVRVYLKFQLNDSYYEGKESVANHILKPLESFKSSPLTSGGPPLDFVIRGDEGKAKYLLELTKPVHTSEDVLGNCKWAFHRGDEASTQARYGVAENFYNLVQNFLNSCEPSHIEENLYPVIEDIHIEKFIRLAINYSCGGQHQAACKSMMQAIDFEDSRSIGESEKEQQAYMFLTGGDVALAAALAGFGRREDILGIALYSFQAALENIDQDAPERMGVQRKLNDVAAKLMEIEGGTSSEVPNNCPDCGGTCGHDGQHNNDNDGDANDANDGPGPAAPGGDEGETVVSEEMVAGLLASLGVPLNGMFDPPPPSDDDDNDVDDDDMPALIDS